jgi:hypothetical protein
MAGAMQFSRGEREIVLGRTRHTQVVSYTSRRRVVPRVDPHVESLSLSSLSYLR